MSRSLIDPQWVGDAVWVFRNQKRVLNIRDAAEQIGISPATLSRIERGLMPDLNSFLRCCVWMDWPIGPILEKANFQEPKP